MPDQRIQARSGDLQLSVRTLGEGPLVILMHGWPELGISWRHQMQPLATAGFTVAAPDMRGYGASSKPRDVRAYGLDALADDMAAVADALGRRSWVSVGHDWGAPVAWRTALRFPERVAGVFGLSVPYAPAPPAPVLDILNAVYADRFFYMTYFQNIGEPEAELEADVRASLKQIFFSLSGDAPKDDWLRERSRKDRLLPGLSQAPDGPLSFISDEELDHYAEAFRLGGFFGPISWYRNFDTDFDEAHAYGDGVLRKPAGFLCGEREVVLSMTPGGLQAMRDFAPDLRSETILAGAGHWIQQERPAQVSEALITFLRSLEIEEAGREWAIRP